MDVTLRKHEWIANTYKFLVILLVRYRNGQKNNIQIEYTEVG